MPLQWLPVTALATADSDLKTSPPYWKPPSTTVTVMPSLASTKGPRPVRAVKSPKPGTILTREYRGTKIVVTVRGDREFEWRGQIYRSLSAVAKAVTGSHCSRVAFFKASNRKEAPR